MSDDQQTIGYVVLSKRPSATPERFNYSPAGGIWPDIEPCIGHQAYCARIAAEDPSGDEVEYVIGRLYVPSDNRVDRRSPLTHDRMDLRPVEMPEAERDQ